MQEIIRIINKLRTLSGNEQLDYLKANTNNLLRDVLDYTYNPDKMYKIDECKLALVTIKKGLIPRKLKDTFGKEDWNKFTEILDELSEKRAADLNDVRRLKYFITGYSSLDAQDLMSKVVAKDLRLNLGIKKLQAVYRGFYNKPQVQLAENYKGEVFTNGLYSRKFDGKRMYIMNGIPYSRANKECSVPPVQHILEQICSIDEIKNYFVLDGECLYFEKGIEDFQKGISLCQRDERKFGCDNICYVIFDMIPRSNFISKKFFEPFEMELNRILNKLADNTKQSPCYSLIPTILDSVYIARQDKDKEKLAKLCSQNNWEGLMYRDGDAPYEYKRTKSLLKIKRMQDLELRLVDMEEGTGRHEGRLGALNIFFKDSFVGVGSGFTDEDRDIIWANSKIFLSKKFIEDFSVKVQYFEETVDAKGNSSLRFPVFLCFRHNETKEEFTPSQVLDWCREGAK